jgi:hypothetical protein
VIAASIAVPAGVLGGPPAEIVDAEKEWTIAIYWDADNSLEYVTEFAMTTWESSLPSNANVNIVALIDLLSIDGIWVYEIVDGKRSMLEQWEEMNTADPATLEMFVEYSMTNFPSEKTMLVLQDHGYSWRGLLKDETNGYDLMSFDEVGNALRSVKTAMGKTIDLLALDACNMAHIEGMYELRDAVDYVIASEATMSDDGLPYKMLISDLVANPGLGPVVHATNLVHEYVLYYSSKWDYEHQFKCSQDFATMSAFDMHKIGAVGEAFTALTEVLEPIIPEHMKDIEEARGYALIGTWSNMAGWEWNPDLITFLEGLRTIEGHPELIDAIDEFEMAFDAACIAEDHSKKYRDTVHGLHIWFPPSLSMYNSNGYTWAKQFVYHDIGLDLVAESSWYDCLMAYVST